MIKNIPFTHLTYEELISFSALCFISILLISNMKFSYVQQKNKA